MAAAQVLTANLDATHLIWPADISGATFFFVDLTASFQNERSDHAVYMDAVSQHDQIQVVRFPRCRATASNQLNLLPLTWRSPCREEIPEKTPGYYGQCQSPSAHCHQCTKEQVQRQAASPQQNQQTERLLLSHEPSNCTTLHSHCSTLELFDWHFYRYWVWNCLSCMCITTFYCILHIFYFNCFNF